MDRSLSAAITSVFGFISTGDEITVGGARHRVTRFDADGLWAGPVEITAHGFSPACAPIADEVVAAAGALRSARFVVGTAIVRDGAVLGQRRAYPAEVAGMWELPGGRVEAGESEVEAVRRECLEELGIEVAPGAAVGPDVAVRPDLVLRVYLAELVSGEPRALDHAEVRWFAPSALSSVTWLPADRVVLPSLVL